MFSYVSIFRNFSKILFHHHQLLIAHGWRWDKAIFFNLSVVNFMILLDILLWISDCRTDWWGRKWAGFHFYSRVWVFHLNCLLILDYTIPLPFLFGGTVGQRWDYSNIMQSTQKKKKRSMKYGMIRLLRECLADEAVLASCLQQQRQHVVKKNICTSMQQNKMSKHYFALLPLIRS